MCGRLPELKLREAANEGFELIGSFGGKQRGVGGIELWINQRGEKTNQEIEEVDSQAVRHNVKPLHVNNSQHVDGCHHQCPNPSVRGMGRRFVQIVLKHLRELLQILLHRLRRRSSATATSLHSKGFWRCESQQTKTIVYCYWGLGNRGKEIWEEKKP